MQTKFLIQEPTTRSNSFSIDRVENSLVMWGKSIAWKEYVYLLFNILTLGLLHSRDRKLNLVSILCSPEEADIIAIPEGNSKIIAVLEHYLVEGIPAVAFHNDGKRYFAQQNNFWQIIEVDAVPQSILAYLKIKQFNGNNFRSLSYAQYGPNKMTIPIASFWDILAKTVVHPFYLFQYFSITIWIIGVYYVFASIIFAITASAIYLSTSETVFNLQRLHKLAGQSGKVQRIEENGDILEIDDTELVPSDKFLIVEGKNLPCDAILLDGRVTVDESMLTGESVPVTKFPIETGDYLEDEDILKKTGSILFCGTRVLVCSGAQSSTLNPHKSCVAMVYRTGFRSAKGQLIASLLNGKEGFLDFFADALWVVLVMFVLCTLMYVWSADSLRHDNVPWNLVVLKYFDCITIAVPPALTASLTVATAISIRRLKEKNIFVSDSTRVNWAGLVGAVCFDKTGTLTEDRLHFVGCFVPVWCVQSDRIVTADFVQQNVEHSKSIEILHDVGGASLPTMCVELLASCHGLAMMNGNIIGDPLEVELFRISGYQIAIDSGVHYGMSVYTNLPNLTPKISILRQFEFSAEKLRAGVLVKRPDNTVVYYVKGSPEIILSISRNDSIPIHIREELTSLSRRGLRVIAMGFALFPTLQAAADAMTVSQSELESNITFLGLAFLSNRLKAETKSTIENLQAAKIQCNMITGDHIYTAIAIAQDCGLFTSNDAYIIDSDPEVASSDLQVFKYDTGEDTGMTLYELLSAAHLHNKVAVHDKEMQIAITGRALETVKISYRKLIRDLVYYVTVFARMKPFDKQFIVEELLNSPEISLSPTNDANNLVDTSLMRQSIKSVEDMLTGDGRGQMKVIFCGDGANDMAALRASTVGVSLCEAETSVAAPITSRLQTPSAVVDTMKEGKCSLITAYVLVCFNLMYAVVQLFMACMMYSFGLKIGDYTYLIQDLFFTLVLALAISKTPPYDKLHKELPPQRFFTKYFIFKLFSQMICFPIFQVISIEAMKSTSWYERYEPDRDNPLQDTYAYENTVISTIGLSQIMIASIVSSIGEPFRNEWYTNRNHVICLVLQGAFVLFQLFSRANSFTTDVLEIKAIPVRFCWILVLIILSNLVCSVGLNRIAEWIRKHSQGSQGSGK